MTKNNGGNRLEKIKKPIFSQGRKDRPREPEFGKWETPDVDSRKRTTINQSVKKHKEN